MRSCFWALPLLPLQLFAQVTVDITPGHSTNSFSPLRSIGAGVDGVPAGTVNLVYTTQNIPQMLSAGFGPLTYRLYTELSVQDWHWNPAGSFSGPSDTGYWTGSLTSAAPIAHTHGFNLPRRGFTTDQGTDDSYSRLDDGNPATFWKSNPYLSHVYTGEPDSLHPQWVLFDLGAPRPVNAIQLNWANPFATQYQVQYWTGNDAINNPGEGNWVTFPSGNIVGGQGGIVTLKLAAQPVTAEYIRVWMTASSGTCVENPPADPRDCLGYAINEVGIGTLNAGGSFTDLVVHKPSQAQTLSYCSSVDPWHTSSSEEQGEEQPGLDLIFTSGITRGLPAVIPVTMLYGTPQDAANELTYVESKGYSVGFVEMGEEPDGQYILPEDYAALYLQWAAALHAVDPSLQLGGPVLSQDQEVAVWPDAGGNTSWLNRFFNYLESHNGIGVLAFMSYEHYPYNPCEFGWNALLEEPSYTKKSLETWTNDGLPAGVPVFVTESNVSWDYQERQVALFGALWFSDFTGVFLTLGGKAVYFYEYEPLPLFSSASCNSWGNFGMFQANDLSKILGYTSQYFSAQMLTQQWAEPLDATHYVYPASSNIPASDGAALVTVYSLLRPDGQWSMLLINKDQNNAHAVTVTFHDSSANANHYFSGQVTQATLDPMQYVWNPANASGYPLPDGPVGISSASGGEGAEYILPAASIVVLRGAIH